MNYMRRYPDFFPRLILVISFLPFTLRAQDQLWQSFTNMRTVRGYHDPGNSAYTFSRLMVGSPQGVWAATTGGVLLWETNRQAFRQFTNTDGLRQNVAKALGRDTRGRLWIFLATGTISQPAGLIDIYDPAQSSFTRIDDYINRNIYDFSARGDSMYLALDRGISLYDIGRSEVKETYQNLGRNFPRGTAVNSIFFDGRDLWAATTLGIARTSLNLPNLLAPESWTNYTTAEGLPSPVVRGFARFSQRLVAATANGVTAFDGQRWTDAGLPNTEILQLVAVQENGREILYAATPFDVFRSETLGMWIPLAKIGFIITGIVIDEAGTLWASTYDNGLYEFDRGAQNWLLHEPSGPATNSFASLSLDREGNLWCTSRNNGFQIYDGMRWYNYNRSNFPSINNNDIQHIIHLTNGEHWVATFGSGIYVLTGKLEALTIQAHLDDKNGILATAIGTTNFPVVPFLKQDNQGNLWILNYQAANTNALLVRTPSDQYAYFSTSDGLRSFEVTVLEIEKRENEPDRIWVGTSNGGVSVLDYNGTIQNKSDDDFSGELDLDDNLLSLNVTSIAQDRNGEMWIGTDKGLNYLLGGGANDRFCYSLISDDVKIIKVDPRNNKWVGTSAGITVLSGEDNCSTTEYTVENSPLVGSLVTSIAFNTQTGDAWIGTTTGLSRFRTPFTEPKPDLSQLTGYPNPFMLDERTATCGTPGGFRITNLAEESEVKIYSINGELIRSYEMDQVPGAQVCWDGRDDSGKLVPSGIYLFVAFVESSGASAVGKVAVVRR